MTFIIDDVIAWLNLYVAPLVTNLLIAIFMPLAFIPLYLIFKNVELLISTINSIINIINVIVALPNVASSVMSLYFKYFPSPWAAGIFAGIAVRFGMSTWLFIKSHIPTMGGSP